VKGKIALEEHFAIPETLQDSAGFVPRDASLLAGKDQVGRSPA
jgi:hypothetical protein